MKREREEAQRADEREREESRKERQRLGLGLVRRQRQQEEEEEAKHSRRGHDDVPQAGLGLQHPAGTDTGTGSDSLPLPWVKHTRFVPSDEWQTVPDGMEVPAGLHLRMDLQTHKNMAKIMQNKPGFIPNAEKVLERRWRLQTASKSQMITPCPVFQMAPYSGFEMCFAPSTDAC